MFVPCTLCALTLSVVFLGATGAPSHTRDHRNEQFQPSNPSSLSSSEENMSSSSSSGGGGSTVDFMISDDYLCKANRESSVTNQFALSNETCTVQYTLTETYRALRHSFCEAHRYLEGTNHYYQYPNSTLPNIHKMSFNDLNREIFNRVAHYGANFVSLEIKLVKNFREYPELVKIEDLRHDLLTNVINNLWHTGRCLFPDIMYNCTQLLVAKKRTINSLQKRKFQSSHRNRVMHQQHKSATRTKIQAIKQVISYRSDLEYAFKLLKLWMREHKIHVIKLPAHRHNNTYFGHLFRHYCET